MGARSYPSSRRSRPSSTRLTRQRTAEIIARYPQSRSALLPLLHLVQSVEGYVSQDGIRFCAEVLELTTAEVSAVATFYTMYKRTPCGEHLVSVCTNTLCAALGGDAIYAHAVRASSGSATRRRRASPARPGRSPWSTPSAWRPATSPRCCRSTTSTTTTRPSSRPQALVDALQRGERPQPTRGAPLTDLRDRRAGAGRDLPGPRRARCRATRRPPRRCAAPSSPRSAAGWRPRCRTSRPPCRTCRRRSDDDDATPTHPGPDHPGAHPALASARAPGTSTSTSSSRATPRCGTRSPATRTS